MFATCVAGPACLASRRAGCQASGGALVGLELSLDGFERRRARIAQRVASKVERLQRRILLESLAERSRPFCADLVVLKAAETEIRE